ncbi:MAG: hypothetical protein CMO55_07770 [Verrucomicrobiales bacterium]|nr:hypothetical protein [Verrucomicrobiales bacterium]
MKDLPPFDPHACVKKYLAKRLANGSDCPVYKGPESLKESDATHFLVPMQSGMGLCRVRREAIANGVPDDETLFDESLVGGIEDDFPDEI